MAALGVLTYVWWLPNYFVADDWVLVGGISQPDWTLADLLPFREVPHRINSTQYYAPVLTAVLWASYKLGGFTPDRYHLILLAFHVATSLALFAVVLQLTGSRLKATTAGALFAVHFASTEAVGWLGGGSHPIATFFGVVALACYARYLEVGTQDAGLRTEMDASPPYPAPRPGYSWLFGALLALLLASLVQVTALPWFAVLACLDLLYSRSRGSLHGTWRRLALLGLLLILLAPLQVQALRLSGGGGYHYQLGPWVVRNLFFYPVSTVVPSLEGPSTSLTRDLLLAPVQGDAFIRLVGMADAFTMLLASGIALVAVVLLWARGGWLNRFAVASFFLGTTPFLLLNGHGYRYLYMPLLFFSLAVADVLVDQCHRLRAASTGAAVAVLAIVPLFIALSFVESQRQLFWWQQAGFVAHRTLQQLHDMHPQFPPGAKIVFGGPPDTLQNTNAQVWRNGITEAVRAVYGDQSLRVEGYTREEMERLFRAELKGVPDTYGFVWEDWQLKQIAP